MIAWFKKKLGLEQRALTPESISWQTFANRSLAGVVVDECTALNISAVFAAIDAKSNDFAGLPCQLFHREPKAVAKEHPVYRLIHDKPNNLTSNFLFRKTLMVHCHTNGNGYGLIVRNGAGEAIELDNIHPCGVQVQFKDNGSYQYLIDGNVRIDPDDMLHVRYFGSFEWSVFRS